MNLFPVVEDAARFRTRAKECRDRASTADFVMRQYLLGVADDLDAEADKIEADASATQSSSNDQSTR